MSSAPVLNPMATAPGCLTFHPTFFISKTPHPFLAFPLRPIKPLHISSLSSHCPLPSLLSIKKKLHFTPLVAQTTNWAQPEGEEAEWDDEEHVEGGVVVGREPEGAGFSEEESYPEPQEEAKLFVGNLPFDMDSEKLAKLFDKVGVVEIAEVIYNRETDQSRGFGFVTMSTAEDAEKAVQMFHRFDVGGRLLTVNKAAPRGTRPERSAESEATYKVYVGNLPWQVDDARLVQLFSDHGEVLDARVVYDRESGRSRGFGFVGMASKAEMDDAVSALDGQSLDGRTLRVNPAEERARRASF